MITRIHLNMNHKKKKSQLMRKLDKQDMLWYMEITHLDCLLFMK